MHCPHGNICSGCLWINLPFPEQIQRKIDVFWREWHRALLPEPKHFQFKQISEFGLRDRVDLTYQNHLLSLYQKDLRETFEMTTCPQMSDVLNSWFTEFRKIKFPIHKGSLRLRVSDNGKKGVWLDFANQDIKLLFEEKNILLSLLDKTYVEIGQRRKKLYYDGERLRLSDPEYHHWTYTVAVEEKIPLYSLVASFSQSGHRANQFLINEIENFANLAQSQHWVEFGAGTGNLSFPLSAKKRSVTALEFDELSLSGLKMTLKEQIKYRDLIKVLPGDFQRKELIDFTEYDGILANPPRSGLINFLEPLQKISISKRPKNFIYMSCYLDSFIEDSLKLNSLGYIPMTVNIMDQFPQTPHFEILSFWTLGD